MKKNIDSNHGITVCKRIRFCAGHRLLNHGGKCENLHGHNYLLELHVQGDKLDSVGRLVDFSVIDGLFKSWIDRNWDHAMLIWEADTTALLALRSIQPGRVFEMPWNPTAENMARFLIERVGPDLLSQIPDYQLRLGRVVVWETENSSAQVEAVAGETPTNWSADATWQQVFSG